MLAVGNRFVRVVGEAGRGAMGMEAEAEAEVEVEMEEERIGRWWSVRS